MTPQSGPAAVPATILFLRLPPPAEGTPAPEGDGRDRLAAVARAAAAAWHPHPHLVLQAPQGLVLVGAVPAPAGLEAARRAIGAGGALPLAVGLHHGPVRALPGPPQAARVAGEALETAAALAGLGGHPVVASGAFRAALAAQAPGQGGELRPLREGVPEPLRAHGPHLVEPGLADRRATRRSLLGAGGMVALLGAGWVAGFARERYEAAHRPAVLVLDIRPSGEVFVDGAPRGTTPPLERLPLPPGEHAIEVRNGRQRPLRLQLQLQPGEEKEVKHVFAQPAPRRARPPRQEPGPFERFKFW